MRIAILTPYTEPVKGGVSSYARELTDAYRELAETAGYSASGRTNSRFIVLGPSRIGFASRVFLRLAFSSPDLIHAHSHWYALLPGYLVRKLKWRTRLLFTFHTMPTGGSRGLGHLILRAMLRSCDGVTFVSRQLRESMRVPSDVRQAVIYPAPERDAFNLKSKRYPSTNPTILFVGPLVWPAKASGVSKLLEAFGAIAPSHTQWRLAIIGDGPFRARLETEALESGLGGKVSFLGMVDNVFPEMAQAEVYAQVSLQEGLPLSLLNAMALGKPVLATSVGGMPEVVADGVTGRLVLPSTSAITTGLEELISDANLRDRLGKAAREWVINHLTWRDVASRHIALVKGS